MAADDDPIFLQVKEARKSVLEPYAGKSLHRNHGERVVAGQRLMQAASDIFLGWTRGVIGRDIFPPASRCENLSDPGRLGPHDFEGIWQALRLGACAGPCAIRDPATIAGYMGSNTTFDDAVCEFAVEYADQNLRDYRGFVKAIREGQIPVASED